MAAQKRKRKIVGRITFLKQSSIWSGRIKRVVNLEKNFQNLEA